MHYIFLLFKNIGNIDIQINLVLYDIILIIFFIIFLFSVFVLDLNFY